MRLVTPLYVNDYLYSMISFCRHKWLLTTKKIAMYKEGVMVLLLMQYAEAHSELTQTYRDFVKIVKTLT